MFFLFLMLYFLNSKRSSFAYSIFGGVKICFMEMMWYSICFISRWVKRLCFGVMMRLYVFNICMIFVFLIGGVFV